MKKLKFPWSIKNYIGPIGFVVAFLVIGGIVLIISHAQNPTIAIEAETGTVTNATVISDGVASGGKAVRFGTKSTGTINLPAPINPGDYDFGRIVRENAGSGGTIVLPDGNYYISDITNVKPSKYFVIVAQNKGGVKVIRRVSVIGQTDQMISNSSNLIFVGINFTNIQTAVSNSSNIHFWYTLHTYPIETHPDPTETYCGNNTEPSGMLIGGSTNVRTYGSNIVDIGSDALHIANSSNLLFQGIRIADVWSGGLQQGRGNERCGWDGNDNYHNDGIQIYPGGVHNLTFKDSYLGRRLTWQVDGGGTSNTNLIAQNILAYSEPPQGGCIVADMRVKSTAVTGSTMDVHVSGVDAWCAIVDWTFYVAGSVDKAMTINGTPILSTDRNASKYFTQKTGIPDITKTPAETWRAANPYNTWPCFLAANVSGFINSYTTCSP